MFKSLLAQFLTNRRHRWTYDAKEPTQTGFSCPKRGRRWGSHPQQRHLLLTLNTSWHQETKKHGSGRNRNHGTKSVRNDEVGYLGNIGFRDGMLKLICFRSWSCDQRSRDQVFGRLAESAHACGACIRVRAWADHMTRACPYMAISGTSSVTHALRAHVHFPVTLRFIKGIEFNAEVTRTKL